MKQTVVLFNVTCNTIEDYDYIYGKELRTVAQSYPKGLISHVGFENQMTPGWRLVNLILQNQEKTTEQ